MLYNSGKEWHAAAHKSVSLIGMSGLGKTYLSENLHANGGWFHYSVDYRIGTRYMGEHIVGKLKREAMQNPFLRDLLETDSIYIAPNITFENLSGLSNYLGKPGNPAKGGIPFAEYLIRQRQHRAAEVAALIDSQEFADKAKNIYGYDHFISDTSGSICEVVDAENPDDPVMVSLSAATLPVWIKGTDEHTEELKRRFCVAPKPMYYREAFLTAKWHEYLEINDCTEAEVDPDDFIRWGFNELLQNRPPRYASIAKNWGVTVDAAEVRTIRDSQDFCDLIAIAIDRK